MDAASYTRGEKYEVRKVQSAFIAGCLVISLCSGFFRPASSANASATDLFISEYIEGSGNDKALEMYNGTGVVTDLTAGDYSIQVFFNGAAKAELTIPLAGSITSGDVHVVAQSSAASAIFGAGRRETGLPSEMDQGLAHTLKLMFVK